MNCFNVVVCCGVLCLAFRVCLTASPLSPPQEEDVRTGSRIDIDVDSIVEFDFLSTRLKVQTFDGEDLYEIDVSLRNHHPSLLLRATSTRIQFREGESISSDSPRIKDEWGSNWVSVGSYLQRRYPGSEWRYTNPFLSRPPTFWSSETNLLFGCRFHGEDGVHHGWIQLTRPDRNFLSQYDVAKQDWNPLPGESIRAGLPPEIPLTSEVVPEGVRVRWPVAIGLAPWILEYSDSLGSDALWVPVPDAANGEIVLEPPESLRFYRLRRP